MATDTKSYDFERNIAVAPDRLWPLLTDVKHREHWGVPDPSMVLEVELADTRVGGLDRHRCGPKDDPAFYVDTRWYDLAPSRRAVFTETLIFGGAPVATSLVTYALQGTKTTILSVTVAASSFSGPDALEELYQGWIGGLDTLLAYAAQIDKRS